MSKNMKHALIPALVLIGSLAALSARAEVSPELARAIDEQVTVMEGAATAAPATAAADDWIFRRFWLRVRPKATVEIPGLAKVTAIPELELLLERPMPAGWTGYKPQH